MKHYIQVEVFKCKHRYKPGNINQIETCRSIGAILGPSEKLLKLEDLVEVYMVCPFSLPFLWVRGLPFPSFHASICIYWSATLISVNQQVSLNNFLYVNGNKIFILLHWTSLLINYYENLVYHTVWYPIQYWREIFIRYVIIVKA